MLTNKETSRYTSIVNAINNLIDHVDNLEEHTKIYQAKIDIIADIIKPYSYTTLTDEQYEILKPIADKQKSIVNEGMPYLNEEEETTNKLKKLVHERDLLDVKSKAK